jgi:hypothetical protein
MAQLRGAFPFPFAQPAEGGGVIALASGGVWYPPPGEWLCQVATNTTMEWWDPIAQFWRPQVSQSNVVDYFSTDGYNYRLLNLTGIVTVASFAAGSGGTNGIGTAGSGVLSIIASNTTGGAQATGYVIVGGSVAAPTITQAGSGFLVPPLVVIDPPPPGGIQATATCALTAPLTAPLTGSGIASITMANVGAGYPTTPNFYLIPQTAVYQGGPSGGSTFAAGPIPPPGLVFPSNAVPGNQNTSPLGAQLTSIALTGSGTVTGVVIVNSGGGYTGTPTGTITGVGAATVTMAAVTGAAVTQSFFQPRVQ